MSILYHPTNETTYTTHLVTSTYFSSPSQNPSLTHTLPLANKDKITEGSTYFCP